MKTWEEIVHDRKQRYLSILGGANDVHLGFSACDELRMILESCAPVVRCKDCRWDEDCCRNIRPEGRRPDDYCSFGERKENPDGDD